VIVWTSLSGRPPGLALLLLPGAVLLMIVTTVAVGLALAALNVEYRDVRYATPFLLQVWLFATPVVYPSSVVPAPWRAWLGLNPMAGVVETFRAALLGTGVHAGLVLLSAGTAIAMLLAAAAYFSRPGPRLVEGIELLGHLLHPDLVPAPPTRRSIELAL